MKKNFRELLKHLPVGYTIGFPIVAGSQPGQRRRLRGHNSHPCILRPDGTPLRDADGKMFHVSSTPNQAAFKSDLRRVRAAFETISAEVAT